MFPQLLAHPLELVSTTKLVPLGTQIYTGMDQARKGYRMCSFPASTAFTAGLLLTAAAAPAGSTGLALDTSNTTTQLSAGSTQVIVTNGSTSVTADQFVDGMLEVLGTNGLGQAYRIAGNSAAGNAGLITVLLQEPLRNLVALANGTNTVNLRQSSFRQATTSTAAGYIVGATIMPIASNTSVQWGWVQFEGAAFMNATSGTKGQPVSPDLTTNAGYVANQGSGASETVPQIGVFKESVASTLASVQLLIP
jgi:hypothetical protein